MQLQRVYVIKAREDGVYTINGIPLPNSVFTGTSHNYLILLIIT